MASSSELLLGEGFEVEVIYDQLPHDCLSNIVDPSESVDAVAILSLWQLLQPQHWPVLTGLGRPSELHLATPPVSFQSTTVLIKVNLITINFFGKSVCLSPACISLMII